MKTLRILTTRSTRLLPGFLVLLMVVTAGLLAGCGGEDEDPAKILEQAFSGGKYSINSGKVDASVTIEAKGSEQLSEPVSFLVKGAFQSTGDKQVPKADLDFELQGSNQTQKFGIVSTGSEAFIKFGDKAFAVPESAFKQYEKQLESSTDAENNGKTLTALGLDPKSWLTEPKLAGDAKVAGVDTHKITTNVDSEKLATDLVGALSQALSTFQPSESQSPPPIPFGLSDDQRKQLEQDLEKQLKAAAESVGSAEVEVLVGKDDGILRRLVVQVNLNGSKALKIDSAQFHLDITFSEVNQEQTIEAPKNALSLDKLSSGELDLSSILPVTGSIDTGKAKEQAEEAVKQAEKQVQDALKLSDEQVKDLGAQFQDCVREAGSDVEKVRKCAEKTAGRLP